MLVAGVLLAVPATVSAAETVRVDENDAFAVDIPGCGRSSVPAAPPCKTINGGVDSANSGDTVSVAPGLYGETVSVGKSIRIEGAQHGVDARSRTVDQSQESTVQGAGGGFNVGADGVVIDGFTIRDADNNAGISLYNSGAGYQLLNNIIRDNTIGVSVATTTAGTPPQTVLRHNLLVGNNRPGAAAGTGIYSDAGLKNVIVDANQFGTGDNADSHSNVSMNFTGDLPTTDLTISNNDLREDNEILVAKSRNVRVVGNRSTGSMAHAVELAGGNQNVRVESNFFSADWSGVRLHDQLGNGPNTGVTIIGNALVDNHYSAIRASDGSFTETPTVIFNRIVDNDDDGKPSGVINTNAVQMNVDYNWWGCNAGPGQSGCDVIDPAGDNVQAIRWLQFSASSSPSAITTGGATSTISAGIRSANDGTSYGSPPIVAIPGTDVAFSASLGSIAGSTPLGAGLAGTPLTSGAIPGAADITATLDSQSAQTSVAIVDPPPANNPGGGQQPQPQPQQQQEPEQSQQEQPLTPRLMSPFPVVRFRGDIRRNGVIGRSLKVTAPRGSSVRIRCTGRRCGVKNKTSKVRRRGSLTFSGVRRLIPSGSVLHIYVTAPNAIGKYTRFRIRGGKAPARTDRCLMPNSSRPVRCPAA